MLKSRPKPHTHGVCHSFLMLSWSVINIRECPKQTSVVWGFFISAV